jgi:hypothetical protein
MCHNCILLQHLELIIHNYPNTFKFLVYYLKHLKCRSRLKVMSHPMQLLTCFSLKGPGFSPKVVEVGFVVDQVAIVQTFLRALPGSSFSCYSKDGSYCSVVQ